MSYPDEWEERVEGMIHDLAAAGELPRSPITARDLADYVAAVSSRRFIADRIFSAPRSRTWGESLWTARDLVRPAAPLVFIQEPTG